jgi:hypothetical protein
MKLFAGYGGSHGSHSGHSHAPTGHPGHFGHHGHFAHHPHFRFRGHGFIVIGAPLFAAPWLYYPYSWDPVWGPRYYVPGQPGTFLYYCQDPPGYFPEVRDCPGGWVRVIPEEAIDPGY